MVNAFYESVLTSEIVGKLQNYAYQANYIPVKQNYMGKIYQSVDAHRLPGDHPLEKSISQIFLAFNNEYFHYDLWGKYEIQFLRYSPGGLYKWHCDYGIAESGARKLSMSIQLSPTWDYTGGELRIKDWHNRTHIVSKEIGNVIVFDSRAAHTVTPIVGGERYAIVAWANGPELR